MERNELQVLHYITPICNVTSILQYGLGAHRDHDGDDEHSFNQRGEPTDP